MTWLRIVFARLSGFFTRKQADRELNDEIRAHLEMLEEENRRKGMTATEAHDAARREFGGVEQMKETYRETNGLRFIETLVQDLRYGLRMLRRNPGFAVTVVVLLALGIGANTAIFSAIDAVMLRLLPLKDPQQLVMLQWQSKDFPQDFVTDLEGGGGLDPGTGLQRSASFSYHSYQQLRDQAQSFSSAFAFIGNQGDHVNLGLNGRAEDAIMQGVSGNFFDGVAVSAMLGRTIQPADDQENAPPVAVVSFNFWKLKLGQDRSIIDKAIMVNGNPVTIVGVAPRQFFGLEPGFSPDLWVPLSWYSWQWTRLGYDNNGLPLLKDPKTWWLTIAGRLKPGISASQAQAENAVLFDESIKLPSATKMPDAGVPRLRIFSLQQGTPNVREGASGPLFLLMAMVALVLLIACANVAGLLLTRATARRREIAVRLSLGASRWRLMRQLLTESGLLAILGGIAGLLFALWAQSLLVRLLGGDKQMYGLELHLNSHLLWFAAGASLLSGALFGLAPAFRATRVDLLGSLKQSRSTSGRDGNRFFSGKLLAGGQVALCLLLLITAGLFLGTLKKLQDVELGFDRQNLLLFTVRPGLNGYKDASLSSFYLELQRRIQSIPGVRCVSFSQRGPVAEGMHTTNGTIPGYTQPGQRVSMRVHTVGPDYFNTFGIPVFVGRPIGPQDDQSAPHVMVVNQRLVKDYFHGQNPIGHQINLGGLKTPNLYEIVGVAGNVKYGQIQDDFSSTIYLPYQQRPSILNFMTFEVRAAGDTSQVMRGVQQEAQALDKNVPLVDIRTETKVLDDALTLQRAFASLSTSFGSLALILACVGLYGTMAYAVARRTNEIGVRMALGAKRENILGMVLRETLTVVLVGLTVGFALAWFATMALKSQLYGLTAHNPTTLLLATLTIAAVTTVAGYIPARRASRVDPMVALRYE
ncbi:MAG TPA: ABC transporter permease [Candidatus Angelobacter sp.]